MKLRLIASLLLVAMMFAVTTSVAAQTYYFSLDEETVNVYWNADGSVALDYVFVFTNDSGADPIEFVDVGMPNYSYDWSSISADVDGYAVNTSSDYQGNGSYGFAVELGSYAIQPGSTGRVHVYVGRVTDMLYPDDTDETYASGQFTPTWFGSSYVYGNTNVTVSFHLPPGVLPAEPRYHTPSNNWPCDPAPVAAYDQENRITYTWACPGANGHSEYIFGLSFPRSYVPADAVSEQTVYVGGGDGGSSPSFNFNLDNIMGIGFMCCFGSIFFGAPILGVINERKRKMQYLPPKISIEGHGIKRGLTAVEAAILLEQPLDKVMTMILFGVVKKNAATVMSRDPLTITPASPLPEGLHEYEVQFISAFADPNLSGRRKSLQTLTVKLVQTVSDKLKGFSRKETAEYYKAIMERAWQQIEAANTPEVKSQMYDEALEWTMLDKDYEQRTQRTFTGPVYVPIWWHRYDPTFRPASGGSVVGGQPHVSSGGGRVSVPGAAFAASVVNSVQGFSSKVLGDVRTFTSGVTNHTNPMPKSSSSGGYKGGGGHSCACACACAGCACACAGGGR